MIDHDQDHDQEQDHDRVQDQAQDQAQEEDPEAAEEVSSQEVQLVPQLLLQDPQCRDHLQDLLHNRPPHKLAV